MAGNAYNDASHAAMMERARRALDMRVTGMTFSQIGEALGVDRTTAFRYVNNALEECAKENVDKAGELRALELQRLDKLQRATERILATNHVYVSQGGKIVYDGDVKLTDDDPTMKAVGTLLRIMERRAKLLGLDAPQKLETKSTVEVKAHDLSKLSDEELETLRSLTAKAEGHEDN